MPLGQGPDCGRTSIDAAALRYDETGRLPMSKHTMAMVIDAFRPTWGWKARLRAADPADRWKIHLLRIAAGILLGAVLVLLGIRIQRLG